MSDRPIDRGMTALVKFVRQAPGLPGHCVMRLIRQGVARRDAKAAFRRAIDAGRLVATGTPSCEPLSAAAAATRARPS